MKTVLLVAYYYPPIGATGAMRPLNFSRHLASYGWLPTVLATDHPSALPPQAFDKDLLDKVPPGLEVLRVPHANPLGSIIARKNSLRRLVKRRDAAAAGVLGEGQALVETGARESVIRTGLRVAVEALFSFPDLQSPWYRPARRAMLARSGPLPQVIWATGGPWTSLLVGKSLAQRWRVPLVADFRDPWVGGHKFFTSAFLHRQAARLERAVCEAASRIVLNTEELRERFCSTYPQWSDKCVAITNGYADELAACEVNETPVQRPAQRAALELCHFGTVYGNRSPVHLFRAVDELLAEKRIAAASLKLRFIGAWDVTDPACNDLAKLLEERGVLERTPPIPHRQCLEEMRRSDILLILQPDYPLQVPAKIYEYMVAGRPMFVVGGEGATANLVHRHGLGRCCPNRTEAAKRMLEELIRDRSSLPLPGRNDTEQFSYKVISKRLAALFDEVVGNQPSGERQKVGGAG